MAAAAAPPLPNQCGPVAACVWSRTSARLIRGDWARPGRPPSAARKFRDEVRPRFGLMRGREFVMNDMYTFDDSVEAARHTYEAVCGAYHRIFTRLGVTFVKVGSVDGQRAKSARPPNCSRRRQTHFFVLDGQRQAEADTGNIGGSLSHEYHLISPGTACREAPPGALVDSRVVVSWSSCASRAVGEDELLTCGCGAYASNVECAKGNPPTPPAPAALPQPPDAGSTAAPALLAALTAPADPAALRLELVAWQRPPATPDAPEHGAPARLTLVVLAGNRRANPFKLKALRPAWAAPYGEPALHAVAPSFLADALAMDGEDAAPPVELVVDETAWPVLAATGAAADGSAAAAFHRAAVVRAFGDFRFAAAGDRCPLHGAGAAPAGCTDATAVLRTVRGIEVGHAFFLGDKYSSQVRPKAAQCG